MTDTWQQLQAHKRKQGDLLERLAKRRKERQVLIEGTSTIKLEPDVKGEEKTESKPINTDDLEQRIGLAFCKEKIAPPITIKNITSYINKGKKVESSEADVLSAVKKLQSQQFLSIEEEGVATVSSYEIVKLNNFYQPNKENNRGKTDKKSKVKAEDEEDAIASLLSAPTMRETENKKLGNEILDLLNQKTAKEQSLVEKFKSQGGAMVREFCPFGTRDECRRSNADRKKCRKLHFRKILQPHTDEFLGDCSFLNTCFHMDTCKYVHYEVDEQGSDSGSKKSSETKPVNTDLLGGKILMTPAQWIQCDVRTLDFDVIGKFSVIMTDPPWDIHMELPYGTMADHEMKTLQLNKLQDHGYIFLWVTGRAIELGRECLDCWGYKRVDELVWVKTNQLQRLIRTGRTGHWINHGKEHCLIGVKGKPDPSIFNKGLDCDVLVSEVRDTSHKPDEIYGIIERIAPGQRKLEIFGRQHNVQPNWMTLGNQLSGVNLIEPSVVKRFKERYPSGSCFETKPAQQQTDVK